MAATSVRRAFDDLLRAIEPTSMEDRAARELRNEVVQALTPHLAGQTRTFTAGSYGRGTAITPLKDLDVFVVHDAAAHGDLTAEKADAVAEKFRVTVQRALAQRRPPVSLTPLWRAVKVSAPGVSAAIDLVPALPAREGGHYLIPDRKRETWIRTNPEQHVAEAKKHAQQIAKLNRLIKLAKHWNAQRNPKVLGSFHLEVLCYRAFESDPAGYPEGFRDLFRHLARAVKESCPDPARQSAHIDQGMTPQVRDEKARVFAEVARLAEQAVAEEKAGREGEAQKIWRGVLGRGYG